MSNWLHVKLRVDITVGYFIDFVDIGAFVSLRSSCFGNFMVSNVLPVMYKFIYKIRICN